MIVDYSPERVLATHEGFVAVAESSNTTIAVVGDTSWTDKIRALMNIRACAGTKFARACVGRYTIYVAGDTERTIGIVFLRDTDAVKWLLRSARAMLRSTDVVLP